MSRMKGLLSTAASALLLTGTASSATAGPAEDRGADKAATEWSRFSDQVDKTGSDLHARFDDSLDPEQQADLNRTMAWILAEGILQLDRSDPAFPDWIPEINVALPFAGPNPDTIYYGALIDGSGTYRISGRRGTVRIVDIQMNEHFLGIDETFGKNLGNINLDDLKIGDDGSFELILSPVRPQSYDGNWVRLDPSARHLTMRQIALDWNTEIDAQVGIQRLDTGRTKPRASPQDTGRLLAKLGPYVERWVKGMTAITATWIKTQPVNDVVIFEQGSGSNGTTRNQVYYSGRYNLDDDEALILEFTPPEDCPYWSVQLMDFFLNSIEYAYNQTSLNKHTAYTDTDGKVRYVLTKHDPGVANWLEALQDQGFVVGRYYGCSQTPQPTVTKVNVADVRAHLPADTKVLTAEERMEAIRHRVLGSQLRRRW